MDLLQRLLDGIRYLLQVDLADDVETIIGHGFLIFLKQRNLNLRLTEVSALAGRNFAFSDFSDFEKIVEIAGGSLSNLFHGEPAQLSDFAGRFFYICRFISFSAVRNWGQVGAISLDEHAIERYLQRGIADLLGLGKRYIAGK